MSAVVLLSGGLDSFVAAHAARQKQALKVALTFDYGQRAAQTEIRAAAKQAAWLKVRQEVIELPWLCEISPAAVTRHDSDLPSPSTDDIDSLKASQQSAQAVWVPNRNGVFINIAAAFAEVLDCDTIVAGFNAEEAATFSDNSPEYVERCNEALRYSTQNHPTVVSPTLHMSKTEIVERASDHDLPLEMLHSCYREGPGHCWACESCLRLKRALQGAGRWEELGERLS